MFNNPNVLVDLVSLVTVAAVLYFSLSCKRRAGAESPRFRLLLICVGLLLLTDAASWVMDGGARVPLQIVNTLYYALQILYCWLWLLFACEWTGHADEPTRGWRGWLCALPMLAELVVLAVNPLTGWVFVIDADGLYRRGSGYLPNLLPYLIYITAALLLAVRACFADADEERRRHALALCVYMMLPLFGAIMEAFHFGVPWTWPLTVLSLLLVYLGVEERRASAERLEAAKLEVELAESRRAIMLSQIQPHFLYNALVSIAELCHDDPPQAERATIEFSRFLRGNMDSLVTTGDISFEQELEHTRHYLALEKIRFEERLRVEYDIRCTLFRLPPLTLQPIVENAVRNGVCKREEGGTIRISSEETADAFVVTVRDDGVGFDPEKPVADGHTHIGLQNVRERLRLGTGGTLTVRSAPGEGTAAVITLPKGGKPA